MHDPACNDSDFRRWWPVGEVQEQPLSALPASGTITNPVRLVDVMRVSRDEEGNVVEVEDESGAAWIGFWGPFTGLRVGYSPRNSYRISSGAAIVAPKKDLFLSVDAVSAGTASIARFHSREAALAWGQSNNEILRAGGALGPFPAASALSDADANPTTTRIGANALFWSDRNAVWEKGRQPDSSRKLTAVVSGAGLSTTGVKVTRTATQDGRFLGGRLAIQAGSAASVGNATLLVRRTTSAVVYNLGGFVVPAGAGPGNSYAMHGAAEDSPLCYFTGDVIDVNVLVANTSGGLSDITLFFEEERFAT